MVKLATRPLPPCEFPTWGGNQRGLHNSCWQNAHITPTLLEVPEAGKTRKVVTDAWYLGGRHVGIGYFVSPSGTPKTAGVM